MMFHIHSEFSYYADHLDLHNGLAVIESFNTLKPSAYKDGQYRLRRYSCLRYDQQEQRVYLTENTGFLQSGEFNQFQGDMVRSYDNLTSETLASPAFVAMTKTFIDTAELTENAKIEIHQMRIIAKDNVDAVATPEGIHQDGFDFIGVFTIGRKNVAGGELLLWHSKTDAEPLAKLSPEVGDFCILNDRTLWHSATNVVPESTGEAYWDLFVMTANA